MYARTRSISIIGTVCTKSFKKSKRYTEFNMNRFSFILLCSLLQILIYTAIDMSAFFV